MKRFLLIVGGIVALFAAVAFLAGPGEQAQVQGAHTQVPRATDIRAVDAETSRPPVLPPGSGFGALKKNSLPYNDGRLLNELQKKRAEEIPDMFSLTGKTGAERLFVLKHQKRVADNRIDTYRFELERLRRLQESGQTLTQRQEARIRIATAEQERMRNRSKELDQLIADNDSYVLPKDRPKDTSEIDMQLALGATPNEWSELFAQGGGSLAGRDPQVFMNTILPWLPEFTGGVVTAEQRQGLLNSFIPLADAVYRNADNPSPENAKLIEDRTRILKRMLHRLANPPDTQLGPGVDGIAEQ